MDADGETMEEAAPATSTREKQRRIGESERKVVSVNTVFNLTLIDLTSPSITTGATQETYANKSQLKYPKET